MKTYHTQADFLKDFPIKNNIIDLKNNSVELLFHLLIPPVSIVNAGKIKARSINAQNIKDFVLGRSINANYINTQDIKAVDMIDGKVIIKA